MFSANGESRGYHTTTPEVVLPSKWSHGLFVCPASYIPDAFSRCQVVAGKANGPNAPEVAKGKMNNGNWGKFIF